MALACQSGLLCDAACLVNAELGTSPLTTFSPPHMVRPKGTLAFLIYLSLLLEYGARPCLLSQRAAHALFDHRFPSVVGDEHPNLFKLSGTLLPEFV